MKFYFLLLERRFSSLTTFKTLSPTSIMSIGVISFEKLNSFLEENKIKVNFIYSLDDNAVFLECVNLQNNIIFFIKIPQTYTVKFNKSIPNRELSVCNSDVFDKHISQIEPFKYNLDNSSFVSITANKLVLYDRNENKFTSYNLEEKEDVYNSPFSILEKYKIDIETLMSKSKDPKHIKSELERSGIFEKQPKKLMDDVLSEETSNIEESNETGPVENQDLSPQIKDLQSDKQKDDSLSLGDGEIVIEQNVSGGGQMQEPPREENKLPSIPDPFDPMNSFEIQNFGKSPIFEDEEMPNPRQIVISDGTMDSQPTDTIIIDDSYGNDAPEEDEELIEELGEDDVSNGVIYFCIDVKLIFRHISSFSDLLERVTTQMISNRRVSRYEIAKKIDSLANKLSDNVILNIERMTVKEKEHKKTSSEMTEFLKRVKFVMGTDESTYDEKRVASNLYDNIKCDLDKINFEFIIFQDSINEYIFSCKESLEKLTDFNINTVELEIETKISE